MLVFHFYLFGLQNNCFLLLLCTGDRDISFPAVSFRIIFSHKKAIDASPQGSSRGNSRRTIAQQFCKRQRGVWEKTE
jgi:hypothetical protein